MKTRRLCLITARGGSKRIPRKNIRPFLGVPIIAYSIQAALSSELFDEVMVSTDDQEIAEIAKKHGAKVPFMRSEKNSNDFAITADVIREVLDCYKERGQEFDTYCCIYPTAPFVTAEKLKRATGMLEASEFETIFPITRFSFPIQRAVRMESNGAVFMVDPRHIKTRSQDLEPRYHDCGQFYIGRVPQFYKSHSILPEKTMGIEVPESEVQDIDSEEDWKIAEIKYQFLKSRS